MSRAATLRDHVDTTDADHIVVLHDVSWEDYERLLEMRGEHSAPRISYLEGEVEIMSPSEDHEHIKSTLGHLLEMWCVDRGIEIRAVGSWTLRQRGKKRGVEADECYVFGPDKRKRPDLAIEIEWTQHGIDKLAIYEKLGVEEVWFWRRGVIEVYALTEGNLVRTERSKLLPQLDLELLASVLDRDTITQAVRDFRKALAKREA
ncbi:MAG TPA: Uma2 family endonuclease [Thermoanaerobaculia bacterium]|nr:Uma2 family endonuclease [Thermoanaerobaculia bacterium]